MQAVIDGHTFNIEDDESIANACAKRADDQFAKFSAEELSAFAKAQYAASSYAAIKFGAVASYIKSGAGELPVEVLFEFADLLGAIARMEFSFSKEESDNAAAPAISE